MQSHSHSVPLGASLVQPRVLAGVMVLALGAFFVLGVGFAGSEVMHNAAHDARHAFAFPCH